MHNRISYFYDDSPLSDFFADADCEVHGQPFGSTCLNCDNVVPEGWTCCPHCGASHDNEPSNESVVTDGGRIDLGAKGTTPRGTPRSFASDVRQLAVLACCWFLVGVVLRVWIRGLQVEWTLFLDWWNG